MGFRRSKEDARFSVLWDRFRAENVELIQESGIPSDYFEDRQLFDDFLMHGCLDHHPDTTGFTIEQLDLEQLLASARLAAAYFRMGLPDPCLMLFGTLIDNQIRAAAKKE